MEVKFKKVDGDSSTVSIEAATLAVDSLKLTREVQRLAVVI
jgi:hypothetical protein